MENLIPALIKYTCNCNYESGGNEIFRPKIPGFLIGMKIVIVNMLKTLSPFHSNPNVNCPFEKKVAPRSRGVIALDEEACTSCMLCARQCPDWCIYIEGHMSLTPSKPGGRQRSRAVLDRFDIDYTAASRICGSVPV